MRHSLRTFVSLCLLSCVSAQSFSATGRTPGVADVAPGGSATYSIPLWTPPGTAGLKFPLGISYHSGRENGLLGMGFGLNGFSAITRCAKTIAQDGTAGPILRSINDGYCLDGKRLRLESGTYGAVNSVYRTEVEEFSKIVATVAGTNGPAVFEVWRKDGMILRYGGSASSRVEYVGNASVREWALSSLNDRSGNRLDLSYIEDGSPNGGYRPDEITYVTNTAAGLTIPPYKIKFVYETATRPDPIYLFSGGGAAHELKRLQRIEMQHNSSIVRQYLFAYTGSTGASGRSRLQSIQECAATTGDCFTASQFTWTNSVASYGSDTNPGQTVPSGQFSWHMIDVDADGRDDLVYVSHATAGSGTWRIRKANASGGFDAEINTGLTNTAYLQAMSLEWDGDGRIDLIVPYTGGRWHVLRSNGSGFDTPFDTGISVAAGDNTRVMDINGDGLDDLVRLTSSGQARVWVRYRAATNFDASETQLWQSGNNNITFFTGFSTRPHYFKYRSRIRRADFNGDGREDFLAILNVFDPETSTNTRYYAGFSAGVFLGQLDFTVDLGGNHLWADLNGDGNTDIVWVTVGGQVRFLIGSGLGYTATVNGPSTTGYVAGNAIVSDYDGDGRDDFLIPYATGSLLHLMRSTGSTISAGVSTGLPWSGQVYQSANIDGDYYNDLATLTSTTFSYRTHNPTPSDLLDTATDGYSVSVDFDYAPLTDTTVHQKLTGAVFPARDMQVGVPVVKQYVASNGIGGTYTMGYFYKGARTHLQGRGFLGFAERQIIDSRSGVQAVEEYSQSTADYERIGALTKQTLKQSAGGTIVSELSLTWNKLTFASGFTERRFPYVSQRSLKTYEVGGTYNGAWLTEVATSTTVDSFGTPYDVTTTRTERASANGVQPSAQYTEQVLQPTAYLINDTTNWCLGRPTQIQFINSHTEYDGTSRTRTVNRAWDSIKCRPTQEVIEPGDPQYQVTTDLVYDDAPGEADPDFGNLVARTVTGVGMTARTTRQSWGSTGVFPVSITNALNQVTSLGWNYAKGVQTSETDPNTLVVSWQSDGFGRRTREDRPGGTATTWTYNDCASVSGGCQGSNNKMAIIATELASGGATINDGYIYLDRFDRPIISRATTFSGAYARTERQFDARGRLYRQSAPCWWTSCSTVYWTTFTYDLVSRPTTVSRPLSDSNPTAQTTTTYYEGMTARVVDALGKQSTRVVNARGELARSIDHAGYSQSFDYDRFGNAVRVSDSASNTLHSATYTIRGSVLTTSDPDRGARTIVPNALGEVASQTDALGKTQSFTYDLLGRITQSIMPECTSGTIVKDFVWGTSSAARNIGRLQYHELSGCGQTTFRETFSYDSLGRLSQTHSLEGASTNYYVNRTYHSGTGFLETLEYPTSTQSYRLKVQYDYQNGFLLRAKDFAAPTTVFWQANATDARGAVIDESLGANLQTIRGYDQVTGRIDYIQTNAGLTSLQDLNYQWDGVGNLTERQDVAQTLTERFYYDDLHRLDYSTRNGVTNLDLAYNSYGNITSKVAAGAYSYAYTYHATRIHAVSSINTGSGTLSYAYNANGQMTSRAGGTLAYYNDGLIKQAVKDASNSSLFSYTADGRRWANSYVSAGTTHATRYIGDAAGVLYEKAAPGGGTTEHKHYIRAGGESIALYVRKQATGPVYTNTLYYLLKDSLGSTDVITTAAGAVVVRESFDAFGKRRGTNWTGNPTAGELNAMRDTTRRGFTFHEQLDSVELVHMNGRAYDPLIGRFVSADPFIPDPEMTQAWNRYSYVYNNPLSYTDPSGYDPKKNPEVTSQCDKKGSGVCQSTTPNTSSVRFKYFGPNVSCHGACGVIGSSTQSGWKDYPSTVGEAQMAEGTITIPVTGRPSERFVLGDLVQDSASFGGERASKVIGPAPRSVGPDPYITTRLEDGTYVFTARPGYGFAAEAEDFAADASSAQTVPQIFLRANDGVEDFESTARVLYITIDGHVTATPPGTARAQPRGPRQASPRIPEPDFAEEKTPIDIPEPDLNF